MAAGPATHRNLLLVRASLVVSRFSGFTLSRAAPRTLYAYLDADVFWMRCVNRLQSALLKFERIHTVICDKIQHTKRLF